LKARGIALAWLLALLALPGCTRTHEPLRATVVGVDGADWQVIDPLLERGELPNLAQLIAAGVRGPFQSELPLTPRPRPLDSG
jgi:hypothetical protein